MDFLSHHVPRHAFCVFRPSDLVMLTYIHGYVCEKMCSSSVHFVMKNKCTRQLFYPGCMVYMKVHDAETRWSKCTQERLAMKTGIWWRDRRNRGRLHSTHQKKTRSDPSSLFMRSPLSPKNNVKCVLIFAVQRMATRPATNIRRVVWVHQQKEGSSFRP